jgi:hypothetical protein
VDSFQQNAFYLLAWRALATALVAIVLMATRSFDLRIAFLIGADVALLFALMLIVSLERLSDERIVSTEAWRMLKLEQQPAGMAGRKFARDFLRDLSVRFAASAAAIAAVLSVSALVIAYE